MIAAHQDRRQARLRAMQLEDVEQVLTIDRCSFPMPWSRRTYTNELTGSTGSILLVAEGQGEEENSRVVGMVVVWLVLEIAHVATIAVLPEYRRQGLGGRLLAMALQRAAQKGARSATLEVRVSNTPAQDLYTAFGFERVGLRRGYYLDNSEDALLMTLDPLTSDSHEQMDRLSVHKIDI